ncbi:MAG: electron transfer flavoprotein subunit alpha/FixB family protein [Candidatus Aminicenantales bacterium]
MLLVFIEIRDGKIKKSSLEVLAEARRRADELGWPVAAAVFGSGLGAQTPLLFGQGAKKVVFLEGESLANYSPEIYAHHLAELSGEMRAEAVFFAATAMGRDLAARLAAKLGVSLASDCTRVSVVNGELEFTRPIYASKALLTLRLKSIPRVATLRPNVFPPASDYGQEGEVFHRQVQATYSGPASRVTEVWREEGAELDVTEAEVVISGGRGMKGAENFNLLRELCRLIPRSAVGASRSAVDSGWVGHQHQVGQTGKTVCPNLYLAFGISGAIQHLAGMSGSKVVVAVNKDPEAPIFKVADLGVVADLFQVIPHLQAELKKALTE